MDDEPPIERPDEPDAEPPAAAQPRRRDPVSRAGDLSEMADAAADATWGDTEASRARVPGVLSGDVGPKGKVSAQLRDRSRVDRATYGEVPPGAVQPGGTWLLLVPMVAIALVIIGLVVLVGWLLS